MAEYIIEESGYPGTLKQEIIGELIRCKNCKHQVKEWRDDKRLKDKGYWVYGCKVISDICGYWAWFGQDDEFCSDAERREDEA